MVRGSWAQGLGWVLRAWAPGEGRALGGAVEPSALEGSVSRGTPPGAGRGSQRRRRRRGCLGDSWAVGGVRLHVWECLHVCVPLHSCVLAQVWERCA